eukprot:399131_1
MPYGATCGACRCFVFLLIILALIFMYGTMYKYSEVDPRNNEPIWSDLWIAYLLIAGLLTIYLILDCAFDYRSFVFDPNFTHWSVKLVMIRHFNYWIYWETNM